MKPASLFARWLKRHGLAQREAARVLGVSAPAFHAWIHGRKTPTIPHRAAIERWTDGAVPATAWASDAELAELDRLEALRPYEAKP